MVGVFYFYKIRLPVEAGLYEKIVRTAELEIHVGDSVVKIL